MRNYDFHNLLDYYEFQCMIGEILRIRDNLPYNIGAKGKDNGKDIFYDEENIICQVKNYKDNFTSLKSELKKEIIKVKNNNPKRFILACSNYLTDANKKELVDMFHPYLNKNDIIDAYYLNELLSKNEYSKIEVSYLKLLVPNSFVLSSYLDKIINSNIYTETDILINKIKEERNVHVLLNIFYKASKLLENKKTIIITGVAGAGKSFLAHNLITSILNSDTSTEIYAVNNITDLYKVFKDDKKQVYFFDDFWGDVEYNFQISHEDKKRLVDFINNLNNYNNKYLVLTSREYIFKEGLENTFNNTLKDKVFNLKNTDLKETEKYEILKKHLFNSVNDYDQAASILEDWKYIINSDNYTPRLIETYFNIGNYDLELIDYLKHPFTYWDELLKNMDDSVKYLLLLLAFSKDNISLKELKIEFLKFLQINNLENLYTENFWNDKINTLENNFLTTNLVEDLIIINLKNPSYKDFLFDYFKNNYLFYVFKFLNYYKDTEHLTQLLDLYYKSNCEYKELLITLENKILDDLTKQKDKINLMINILRIEGLSKNSEIIKFIYCYYRTILYDLEDLIYFSNQDNEIFLLINYLNDYVSLKDDAFYLIDTFISCWADFYFNTVSMWVDFKNIFREEFAQYIKEYRNYVKEIFISSIISEAYYYQEENDLMSIDTLSLEANECFLKMNIKYPVSLERKLDEIYDMTCSKDDYSFEQTDINQYEDIKKDVYNILGYDYEIGYEGLTKELKNLEINEKFINDITNIDDPYFQRFSHYKSSLKILINYLKDKNDFKFTNIKDFLNNIVKYLYVKNNFTETDTNYLYIIGVLYIKSGNKYFTQEDILKEINIYEESSDLDKILSSEFFEKRGKWYKFSHFLLLFHIIINFYNIYFENLEFSLFFKTLNLKNKYDETSFNYSISDKEYYQLVKLYNKNLWNKIINEITTDLKEKLKGQDVAKEMIRYFDFTCYKTYEDLFIEGNIILDLFLVEYDISIFKVFYGISDDYFKNYLNKEDNFNFNTYLDDKKFYKLLTNIGLDKKCLEIYELIK